MKPAEIRELGLREFRVLLTGLSDQSRFRQAISEGGRVIDNPAEAQTFLASL